MRFTKTSVFVTNVILFIVIVIVVSIASVSFYKVNKHEELLLGRFAPSPVVILVLGILTIFLGFLGIAGAVRESKYMLYAYAVIMVVFFLVMVVLALIVLIHPSVSKCAFESYMHKKLQKYNGFNRYGARSKKIDAMQEYEQCCGVNGRKYWAQIGMEIPKSCICQTDDENCKRSLGKSSYYQRGCSEAILTDLKKIRIALGSFALILAFVMFFSIVTAIGLAKTNKYDKQTDPNKEADPNKETNPNQEKNPDQETNP